MELLDKLFFSHGAVQTVLVLSITIVFGILLGKIRIFTVSFGIGGILFSGIILGHFGFSLNTEVLVFTREFGLILFVFAIGMQVGPTFLESLRDHGLKLNFMAVFIVLFGAVLAVCCYYVFNLTVPQTAGLFSGAVTNTPSLGSANGAWTQIAGSQEAITNGLGMLGMAYAVAYPFGIFGIILTMMILKAMFKINVDAEISQAKQQHQLQHYKPESKTPLSTIMVTNSRIIGKNLADILPKDIHVAAVARGAEEVEYNGVWRLRLEDRVVCNADKPDALQSFTTMLGDKPAVLAHPQVLAIFLAILFGVFVGSLPVMIPGLPGGIKLGVAGGTLLAGIFLGRVQRFMGLTFYMTSGATQLMRELGILLFLACVGLNAGTGFVKTVLYGPGLAWMGIGAIITFFPLFLAALFCRAVWKINFSSICGMLAGSMTDPPALAFAMQYYGGEITAAAYSTVYPLTMILRILMGQLLVLGLAALG